jgi:hypothetical protein
LSVTEADASQHGVPRISGSRSRDAVKEKRKIQEYQSLVELVNAKVSAIFNTNIVPTDTC